jgi:hypothetical protein
MNLFDDPELLDTELLEKYSREPDCLEGEDHDWQAPHELVGGCESNPGVHVWGGDGVAEEVCMNCGCARLTCWTREGTVPGEDPIETVYYQPGKYADEVAARRAAQRRDIMALLRLMARMDVDPYEYAALAETCYPEQVWATFDEDGIDGVKALVAKKTEEVEEEFGRRWQPLMIDQYDDVWLGGQKLDSAIAERAINEISPRWRDLGEGTPPIAILTAEQADRIRQAGWPAAAAASPPMED